MHALVSGVACASVGTLRVMGAPIRVPVRMVEGRVCREEIGRVGLCELVVLRLFPTPLRLSHLGTSVTGSWLLWRGVCEGLVCYW